MRIQLLLPLCMISPVLFAISAQALTNAQSESMASGSVTEGDAMSHRMDSDGDGKISYEEFKAQRMRQADQQFKFLDVNQDGYIDEVEKALALDKVKKQLKQLREQRIKPNTTTP